MLSYFMDCEANVLQSIKHLAVFGSGHRKIPGLEMGEFFVCVRICLVAKGTSPTLGKVFSTDDGDQLLTMTASKFIIQDR